MLLDDGIIGFYELQNVGLKGDMPKEKLVEVCKQYYGARTISYSRQYQAKSVNEQVDMLVRVWDEGFKLQIGMYAIVDSQQYRITNITPALDDDTGLRIYDITLERLANWYEVNG